MTTPKLSETKPNGRRIYNIGGKQYPGASSLMNGLDKPGLNIWKMKTVAKAIATDPKLALMASFDETCYAATQEALNRDKAAADLGTEVHDACEQLILNGQIPYGTARKNLVAQYVRPFARLVEQHVIRPVLTEQTVYNDTVGYAGTVDLFAAMEGFDGIFVMDYKTGKPYGSAALQLATYANGEACATEHEKNGEPHVEVTPMPTGLRTDIAWIIDLKPDTARLWRLDLTAAWEVVQQLPKIQNFNEVERYLITEHKLPSPAAAARKALGHLGPNRRGLE